MLKQNRVKMIISSVIILLPAVFGIIFWRDLPDMMPTHFDIEGNADGFAGRIFVVFGMPVIFLVMHIFSLLITLFNQKHRDQTPKAMNMVFWIIPAISVLVCGMIYRIALGSEVDVEILISIPIGIMLIYIGNYLPKVKQNNTLGIKVWWTLHNEENWNRTHRFGGKTMVAGGVLLLLSALLPAKLAIIVMFCITAAVVLIPIFYSYQIYRRHKNEGIEYASMPARRAEKITAIIVAVFVSIIILGAAILMLTGDIEVAFEDDYLEIRADYWSDITVDYSRIDSAAYSKNLDLGIRTVGFQSARLLMGTFRNEEFGSYTLYTYASAQEFVVLTSGNKTLVIGMDSSEDTALIYQTVLNKIGE